MEYVSNIFARKKKILALFRESMPRLVVLLVLYCIMSNFNVGFRFSYCLWCYFIKQFLFDFKTPETIQCIKTHIYTYVPICARFWW